MNDSLYEEMLDAIKVRENKREGTKRLIRIATIGVLVIGLIVGVVFIF